MIWCVEDDAGIRDLEVYTLRSTGFEAEGFEEGDAFFEALKARLPDLVLLDVMLPGMDGTEILRRLKAAPRTAGVPVIMATAKGMEYDKVKSLDLGADDYLVKPFGMMEMVARVKAVLRRSGAAGEARELTAGGVALRTDSHTVTTDGEKVELTLKEFDLLCLLMRSPGRVFTRDQLLSEIWGMDYDGETRTVDVHVRTLRAKLGRRGDVIQTVRGVGYRLEAGA